MLCEIDILVAMSSEPNLLILPKIILNRKRDPKSFNSPLLLERLIISLGLLFVYILRTPICFVFIFH